MNAASTAAPRRADDRRPGPRRTRSLLRPAALACAALALLLSGCTGESSSTSSASSDGRRNATDTVKDLGAVPIPTAPTARATPVADEQHLQLVAMGDTVQAKLPEGGALVRAVGPAQDATGPATGGKPPEHTTGTFTVTFGQATAAVTVAAADFSSRDEQGTDVPLTATGPATVTAAPGTTATLTLVGTYRPGSAQLTWRHDGKPVAVWDFTVELD
ncbi:hypothetical protein [Kitasatospora sp. NPDC101183]|uniref:hypothetical protein n=1 Tax=Kitasatospora sp. NPDC101183 TaxID=3364100 RepID=UPI003826AC05